MWCIFKWTLVATLNPLDQKHCTIILIQNAVLCCTSLFAGNWYHELPSIEEGGGLRGPTQDFPDCITYTVNICNTCKGPGDWIQLAELVTWHLVRTFKVIVTSLSVLSACMYVFMCTKFMQCSRKLGPQIWNWSCSYGLLCRYCELNPAPARAASALPHWVISAAPCY